MPAGIYTATRGSTRIRAARHLTENEIADTMAPLTGFPVGISDGLPNSCVAGQP